MRVDRIHESQWPAYLADFMATDEQADYSPELNQWHTFLEVEVMGAFESQSSPEGEGWEPWRWRNQQYHGQQKALLGTGRLYNSFVRGTGENVDQITGKRGTYGSSVEYAGVHQYGGEAEVTEDLHRRDNPYIRYLGSTIDVPARPMLGVRPDMADVLAESVADGIVERMRG